MKCGNTTFSNKTGKRLTKVGFVFKGKKKKADSANPRKRRTLWPLSTYMHEKEVNIESDIIVFYFTPTTDMRKRSLSSAPAISTESSNTEGGLTPVNIYKAFSSSENEG